MNTPYDIVCLKSAVRNLQAKVATDAAKWQPVLDKVVADLAQRQEAYSKQG